LKIENWVLNINAGKNAQYSWFNIQFSTKTARKKLFPENRFLIAELNPAPLPLRQNFVLSMLKGGPHY